MTTPPAVANLIEAIPIASSATTRCRADLVRARARHDPNHVKTWQYYGLWQVEQGNRDQAQYHLNRIAQPRQRNSEDTGRCSPPRWKAAASTGLRCIEEECSAFVLFSPCGRRWRAECAT